MKRINYMILMINLILSLNLFSQPTDYVGYWPFSGNANDISQNTNNGEIYGPILTTDKDGIPDLAYFFDGTDDYINCGNNISLKPNIISICAWIKTDYSGSWMTITSHRTNKSTYSGASMAIDAIGKPHLIITTSGTQWDINIAADNSVNDNAWHFISGTYESGNAYIYIDGVQQSATSNVTGNIYYDASDRLIGKDTDDFPFSGSIDEVMIFDRGLNIEEIQTLYNSTSGGGTSSNLWQDNTENIYYEGKVSIGGTTVPTGFDFSVNGNIVTKEVKVTLDGWSDFVFKSDYQLMPINEVEKYIILNNHLPSIPSEKEVHENGISLGQMNSKLLQKIEELTLYTIEQQKQLEMQMELIEKLEKTNNILLERLEIKE